MAASLALNSGAAVAEPYRIEGTDSRVIRAPEGHAYRVHTYVPEAPAPAMGYPVLYLLDGDDSFAIAVKTVQRMARFGRDESMHEGIIVAIDRDEGDLAGRVLDYTPSSSAMPELRGRKTGGAADFRAFLADTIMPAIRRAHPVDPEREAIWGHSLGGLFVLDTLMRQPGLFDTYVATSPSLWFQTDDWDWTAASSRIAATTPLLRLSHGEFEGRGPAPMGRSDPADALEWLADRLARIEGVDTTYRVLTGERHATTPLPGIGEAVIATFAETSE